MKLRMYAFLVALAAMPAPLVVQAQSTASDDAVFTANAPLLDRAIKRGDMIYAYDQAGWHGTDDLMAKAKAAGVWDTLAPTIGGWIVDGDKHKPTAIFYDKSEQPKAVYIASFDEDGEKLVSSRLLGPGDDRTIAPDRLKLIAARNAGRAAFAAAKLPRCSESPYNTVVLPPETPGGPTLVYLLTPQTQKDNYPVGGHYLIEIAADGTAGAPRPFTKSCIALGAPDGKKPVALVVSHLLDPVPTEIHVFTMRAARLPLYVATSQNGKIWAIEYVNGTRIRMLDPSKK